MKAKVENFSQDLIALPELLPSGQDAGNTQNRLNLGCSLDQVGGAIGKMATWDNMGEWAGP